MDIKQFEGRKRDHIRHALDPAHQTRKLGGLDQIHLHHEALPELAFREVTLSTSSLGQPIRTPFFVAGMTAGHPDAKTINARLAIACARRGWAMGVGSQRRELETQEPEARDLREQAPDLFLFANLGISQLISEPVEKIRRLVESIDAQALVIHANALQECLQPEGTPNFRGALKKLTEVCEKLGFPVILKETGCGFSPQTLKQLTEVGLRALDVSGLGGTHWGRIEGARAEEKNPGDLYALAAKTFAEWGEPTLDSVLTARKLLTGVEIWGSGGVRSGLDAAKLIALGAHRIGYAQPALESALQGEETLNRWMERQEFELKVALFCTGCKTPAELQNKEGVWKRNGN